MQEKLSLKVNLTQENIDRGVRGSDERCPIALAITDALQETEYQKTSVSVANKTFLEVREGIISRQYETFLTPDLIQIIHLVDMGEKVKVKPTQFVLEFYLLENDAIEF